MPKVSVIIPTYNNAKYLPEAVTSVLGQTYKDYEIIVVDDGSSHNTREVVYRFVKSYLGRIKYVYQSNEGLSGARNRGIQEAKGKYIAFLDSDDIWLPGKLKEQMTVFADERKIDFICTKALVINADGQLMNYEKPRNKNVLSFENILMGNPVVTSTVILSKKALEEIGVFDELLFGVQDYALWLKAAQKLRMYFLNKPLIKYRVNTGSNMSNNLEMMYKDSINALKKMSRDPVNRGKIGLIKHRLRKDYYCLAKIHLKNKSYIRSTVTYLISKTIF